jgi:hypothetical protein
LDFFKVPKPEKSEVLAAFATQKGGVTAAYTAVRQTLRSQAYLSGNCWMHSDEVIE